MKTKVVVLKTIKKNFGGKHVYFYFRTDEAAEKFIYVFKNHWCHVAFDKYNDEVELSNYWEEHIDDDPEKIADENLSWGFNFARDNGDDDLTSEENAFIDNFIKSHESLYKEE